MKNLFTNLTSICSLLILTVIVQAQFPTFSWQAGWGGAEFDFGPVITTDPMGNVYCAGFFRGTVDMDPGPGNVSLTSSSGGFAANSYISKFDSSGNFLWVKQIGGNSFPRAIVYHADGYIMIGGDFDVMADFNPGVGVFNMTPHNVNSTDVYLLKLDLDGNFISAQAVGGNGQDQFGAIARDNDDNIIVAGLFTGTSDFDPGPSQTIFTAEGLADLFIVKLNPNGDFIWAKEYSGSFQGGIYGVDADGDGNIYTSGIFDDIRDFDPGPGSVILTASGFWDAFVVKLNPDGDFQWIKRLGNGSDTRANNLIIDRVKGHLYTSGQFGGRMDFDPGPDSLFLIAENTDPYIWKLDLDGNLIWVKQFEGVSFDQSRVITMDQNGNIYSTGWYGDVMDLDPGPGEFLLTSTGMNDLDDSYIAKLTENGDFVWAATLGGLKDDYATGVHVDRFGNVILSGRFEEKAGFYPGSGGQDSLVSNGSSDNYLVRWTQHCAATLGEIFPVVCDSYTSPSGNENWFESGVYIDTLTNAAGCDSIISIHLTVLSLDPTIELNGTTLTSVQDDATYQWVDCDNGFAHIAGATNQSFTPTVSGNYAVIINYGGCETEVSECVNVMLVDVYEQQPEITPRLYPNPSFETWFVHLAELNTNVRVQIANLTGAIVFSTEVKDTNVVPIDTELPAGVYFLKVIVNNEQYVLKGIRTASSK